MTGNHTSWYYSDLWGPGLASRLQDKPRNLKEAAANLDAAVKHLYDDKLTLKAGKRPWAGQAALTGLEKASVILSQLAQQSNQAGSESEGTREYGGSRVAGGEGGGLCKVGKFSRPLHWAGFVVVGGRTWLSEYDAPSSESSEEEEEEEDDDNE